MKNKVTKNQKRATVIIFIGLLILLITLCVMFTKVLTIIALSLIGLSILFQIANEFYTNKYYKNDKK